MVDRSLVEWTLITRTTLITRWWPLITRWTTLMALIKTSEGDNVRCRVPVVGSAAGVWIDCVAADGSGGSRAHNQVRGTS